MKVTLARVAVAGALGVAPLAAPSQASCGPVVIEACRIVCRAGSDVPAVYQLCTIL